MPDDWWALRGWPSFHFVRSCAHRLRRPACPRPPFACSQTPVTGVQTSVNPDNKKAPCGAFCDWWALRGSNSRPSRCKRDALPAELSARLIIDIAYTR